MANFCHSLAHHVAGAVPRVLTGRARDRRGALLLISLIILSLFLLLGTTFLISASQFRPRTIGVSLSQSTIWAAREVAKSNPVVSGPLFEFPGLDPDPANPLQTADVIEATRRVAVNRYIDSALLYDKYGTKFDMFSLVAIEELSPDPAAPLAVRFFTVELNAAPSPDPHGRPYEGRILSIDHDERLAAFRVVTDMSGATGLRTILLVHHLYPGSDFDPSNVQPGATACIQGREFAGDPSRPGELNESYDAPDSRNRFLTWEPTEAILGRDEIPDPVDPSGADPADAPPHAARFVIPAYHRPDRLLSAVKSSPAGFDYRYDWLDYGRLPGSPADRSLLLLRPAGKMEFAGSSEVDWLKYGFAAPPLFQTVDPTKPGYQSPEHPEFTGTNVQIVDGRPRYFDPINGPWDVDNDGDGIADSVWIDIGAPTTTISGQLCRPLVAIKIVDLDCRLNVNVHGSLPESGSASSPLTANPDPSLGVYYAGTDPDPAADLAEKSASLRRGLGWGVADVDLAHLFKATLPRPERSLAGMMAERLLQGTATSSAKDFVTPGGMKVPALSAEGRYGDSRAGSGILLPSPGYRGVADVAADAPEGTTPRYLLFGAAYGRAAAGPGSPADPFGITSVGTDQMGQPLYVRNPPAPGSVNPWEIDFPDNPYDTSVGRSGPRPDWMYDPDVPRPPNDGPSVFRDNLFNSPQLERLLRLHEPKLDVVSPRLLALLGTAAEAARLTLTAESWDTTAVCVPRRLLDPILDLSDQADPSKPSLVSWDLQLGLRMDVNRPFGDGRDNDFNGITDESGESNDFGLAGHPLADQCLTNGRDADGNGVLNLLDASRCRELFARHLFVLAMKTTPDPYWDGLNPAGQARYRRAAAQWAVNVADFRDPDSIMTRFPFDAAFDPTSNEWNVDSTSPVVWGCERPEMLLTEVMAWRNIEERQVAPPPDPEYQYRDDGTGGLMIELYHPWTALTDEGLRGEALPAEFMNNPTEMVDNLAARYLPGTSIDLAKQNPDGQPVFQIVVVRDDDASRDNLLEDPAWPNQNDAADIELVLHPGPGGKGGPFAAGNPFAGEMGAGESGATSLSPGQFALIVGAVDSGDGTFVSPIKGDADDAQAGFQFNLVDPDDFDDEAPASPFQMTDGLTEQITGDNRDASRRTTARALPAAGEATGPVGALILASRNAVEPLRLPPSTSAPKPSLAEVFEQTRHRVILRRLANPLRIWDESTNPYIAIDSMVLQEQGVVYGTPAEAREPETKISLMSTERGAAQPQSTTDEGDTRNRVNNLWRQDDLDATASMDDAPSYAGVRYCGRRSEANTVEASFGFLPANLHIPGPGETAVPPFPLLSWPNRDFASAHEILLVPGEGPATLLRRHTHEWPFGHLYFGGQSLPDDSAPVVPNPDLLQVRLGVLEFLQTPSRFADAELPLRPADCIKLNTELLALGMKPLFLPPHNYVSRFREPGRVNLNTLSSRSVWEAINGGRPAAAYQDEFRVAGDGTPMPFRESEDWTHGLPDSRTGNWKLDDAAEDINENWDLDHNDDTNNDGGRSAGTSMTIASSRRGWELPGVNTPADLDDGSGTVIFAGGFDRVLNRGGIDGGTNTQWFQAPFGTGWTDAAGGGAHEYDSARSVLLRSSTTSGGGRIRPRLLFSSEFAEPAEEEPSPAISAPAYRDPARNPYFYFADVIRLSNVVTPRSNVFAVWWTIGFFTLDDQGRLGAEYGLDSGDNARHKKFMIIDRSIPAGFTPFEDAGTSGETVILERFTN